jgi:hypothetical protein
MALTSARMQSLSWLVPSLYKRDEELAVVLSNDVKSAPPENQFQQIHIPLPQFALPRL